MRMRASLGYQFKYLPGSEAFFPADHTIFVNDYTVDLLTWVPIQKQEEKIRWLMAS